MVNRDYYPPADHKSQWRPNLAGGATFTKIDKLCLHTTETQGWPGYPSFAPHLTYDPWKHLWRQHMVLSRSATTLRDLAGGIKPNRTNVIQIEIVGYCDDHIAAKFGHSIYKIDNRAYVDLAVFAVWLHDHWGLPLESTVAWVRYPVSAGYHAAQRLTASRYVAYKGILGHQHVPENDHGDPGKINIALLLNLTHTHPVPKPTPKIVSLTALINAARHDPDRPQGGTTPGAVDDVKIVEMALAEEHLLDRKYASDGSFGTATKAAYAQWQRKLGYSGKDADGIPGHDSLAKLGARHNFRVGA
jgi:hypothetical protein